MGTVNEMYEGQRSAWDGVGHEDFAVTTTATTPGDASVAGLNAGEMDHEDKVYYEGIEEDVAHTEPAVFPPNDYEMTMETEACTLQANSVNPACDKVSSPEPDHEYETNPEAEACMLQAASVMTACDKVSTPELDHDYENNIETEACTLQAASMYPARNEESVPETDTDTDENEIMETEACTLQAASMYPARDEESAPETDHEDDEMETEACTLQAASMNPACDKESALDTDHEDDEIMETEACTLQAASMYPAQRGADSVNPARDEESAPDTGHDEDENVGEESTTAPDHDYDGNTVCNEGSTPEPDHDFEETMELEACAQQTASVTTKRDEEFAPAPDLDYELTMGTEACTQQATFVATTRDEESAPKKEQDRTEDAGRVPFLGHLCGPDPKLSILFGLSVDWGPASVAPLDALVAEDSPDTVEKSASVSAEPSLTSTIMSVAGGLLEHGRSSTLVGERGCPASRLPRTTNSLRGPVQFHLLLYSACCTGKVCTRIADPVV
ncbi:hypothetical protein PF011_g23786 [Phytophthora fragariae]|uniref:Uncharacterized protein n=1 Tax=Phytophthora fragariae TaxID=53985 RepID=A0A6A3I4R6_9STRA|nr:hypothetical protein PF011_g23786 [Phytophthora fragariae]